MGEGVDIQSGVVLVFGEEGLETLVSQATAADDALTASVQAYASNATSAYAQATAAQRSVIDAYRQQSAAAQAAQASMGAQIAEMRASITELDAYAVSSAAAGAAGAEGAALASEAAMRLRIQLTELTAAQKLQTVAAKEAAAAQAAALRLAGAAAGVDGYMAQADAIVTSNAALGVQQAQLGAIASSLRQDVIAFGALGEEGVAAAEASSEALTLVYAALASIRAEQSSVIAGMAGIAEASGVAGEAMGAAAAKEGAALVGIDAGLVGMAAKMAPLAAAVGIAVLTKDSLEYAVSLEHMHQKLGISTEDLSAFHVAARMNGMDVEDMNRAFVMLAKNIDAALHDVAKPLLNLGETLHMTNDQVKAWGQGGDFKSHVLDIANALDKIPDAETRMAKAAELLSRAGGGSGGAAQLLNTLHSLAGDGFARATEEARKLGVVVDEQTGQSALAFAQSWERVKLELMGAGLTIAQAILPALTGLNDAITSGGDSWTKWLTPLNMIAGAIKVIAGGITAAMEPVALMSATLGQITAAASNLWGGSGNAELSDRSKAIVAAGKTMSKPGSYSFGQDFDTQFDAIHNKYSDIVGGIYGVGGSGMPGTMFDPNYTRPSADETAKLAKQTAELAVSKDQLDIADKQMHIAAASNVIEAQRLEYELKRLEITKQLDSQLKALAGNKDLTPDQKALVAANDRQAAQDKLNAAASTYGNTVAATLSTETEAARVRSEQLATDDLQVAAAGDVSALQKEQLNFAQQQLTIQGELASKLAAIVPSGPTALPKDQQDAERANLQAQAQAKILAARLNYLAAVQRTAIAEADTTRQLNLSADAQERGATIAANNLDLQRLSQFAVRTTAEVQRTADLEKENALLQYADKKAQIDEAERKAIDEQNAVIANQFARSLFFGAPVDTTAIEQAIERIKALQRSANADRVTNETQTATTIAGIQFKSIQDANAARAEARYSDSIMQMTAAQHDAEEIAQAFGDPMTAAFATALAVLVDGMKKAADQTAAIWKSVGDETAKSFSTLFQTLERGGTFSAAFKSMGQSFEQNFGNVIESRIKVWTDELNRVAQGRPILDSSGKPIAGTTPTTQQQQNAKLGQDAMIIGQAGLAGYSAGSGHGQATASAVSAGLGAFMATGNPYIAIAAVIASEIGSALATAQKQSEYLYGVPMISMTGQASIGVEKNINPQKSAELTAQLQTAFNDAWNGFVNVMGKLGGQAPAMGATGGILGQFQPNPSAYWETHFQQYLTDTLPTEIAAMFKSGMEQQFIASGVTSDAFDKFWAEAANLDPTKRVQFWSDLADGIVSLAHAQKVYDSVANLNGNYAAGKFDAAGNQLSINDNDFISSLKTGAKQVYDIARNMVALTGPDRIAAFKAMGAAVDQIAASFAQFMNQIAASIKAVNQQFTDAFLQHDLSRALLADGTPDKVAQAKILENAYSPIIDKLRNAAALGLNPSEIEALTQQGIGILNQIYSLDPSAAADAWWQQQMKTLHDSSVGALQLIGDQAKTQMDQFLATIKPFADYMLGLPVTIDPSIIALEAQFDGLAAAIAALNVSITNNTPKTFPPGAGGSGAGGDGTGGGTGGGTKQAPITGGGGQSIVFQFNLNGTFVDQLSFQDAIVGAVAIAIKENPKAFAPSF